MENWREHAACDGMPTEMFIEAPFKEALAICEGCKVKEECRDCAIEYGMPGVWGGMTIAGRLAYARSAAE